MKNYIFIKLSLYTNCLIFSFFVVTFCLYIFYPLVYVEIHFSWNILQHKNNKSLWELFIYLLPFREATIKAFTNMKYCKVYTSWKRAKAPFHQSEYGRRCYQNYSTKPIYLWKEMKRRLNMNLFGVLKFLLQ